MRLSLADFYCMYGQDYRPLLRVSVPLKSCYSFGQKNLLTAPIFLSGCVTRYVEYYYSEKQYIVCENI